MQSDSTVHYIYCDNCIDGQIIRSFLDEQTKCIVQEVKNQNDIPAIVNTVRKKNNIRIIVCLKTYTENKEMCYNFLDNYTSLLKPSVKVMVLFFKPDVETELDLPMGYRDLTPEHIEKMKENKFNMSLNEKIIRLLEFVYEDSPAYRTRKWKSLTPEMRKDVTDLCLQAEKFIRKAPTGRLAAPAYIANTMVDSYVNMYGRRNIFRNTEIK